MPVFANGFDFPLGNLDGDGRRTATEANDGDGFYTAGNFGDYEDPTDSANDYHLGEDWNAEGGATDDLGAPVYAISNGTVVFAGDGGTGWGNVVIVRHDLPNGEYGGFVTSLYGHLGTLNVALNDVVDRGDSMGVIGPAQGISTGPHLHLEIRAGTNPAAEVVGAGYSPTQRPDGWLDPTDFVLGHRQETAEPGDPSTNRPPVVAVAATAQVLETGAVADANVWWAATDPEGDAISWWTVYDDNPNELSAFFSTDSDVWSYERNTFIPGQIIPAQERVLLTADQFTDLTVRGGNTGLVDPLYATASDYDIASDYALDDGGWGEWKAINLTTELTGSNTDLPPPSGGVDDGTVEPPAGNTPPNVVATAPAQVFDAAVVAEANAWWTATDAEGDTINWWTVYDDNPNVSSAYFSVDSDVWSYDRNAYIAGQKIPSQERILLTAEQFTSLTIHAGSEGLADSLYATAADYAIASDYASDDGSWGEWKEVNVTTESTGGVSLRTPARANTSESGAFADRSAEDPVISRDGRYVAFTSNASDLVEGDTNNTADVFLKALFSKAMHGDRLSLNQ